ncbi:MAG: hypothetical protein C0467_28405 [Planctomycetaceae bacterium]|nr:hypothetical protein [Planctomycetaceae bacterium]
MSDTSHWINEADSQFERIDGVCDKFEDAWAAGSPPQIEVFLSEVGEADRTALMRELLPLELHYRRAAGESPTADEYLQRFPDHAELIATAFASPVRPSLSTATAEGATGNSSPVRQPPTVPGYNLLGELGRGGMGVVYKAHHLKLNRTVALKMILGGAHVSPEQLARFIAEAQATARMHHPHIVQIHEIGETDGLPYFALEFLSGGSLSKKLGGTPQPPREAARLVELLAKAVAYAHKQGIVHRDLKPANILLGESGELKIADFGLAKMTDAVGNLTVSGAVFGTPAYMAPEQARGDTKLVGPAADVWAIGVILFELLTGRLPFSADTTAALLRKVEREEAPSPRALRADLPRDLEAICLMCLEKEPRRRYASADAIAEDLACYLAKKPLVHARPLGLVGRFRHHCRRNPLVAGLFTLAILLAGAVAGLLQLMPNPSPPPDADDSLASVQRAGRLVVGIDPNCPPYAFKENGKLTGFDVELAHALAAQIGVKAEHIELYWDWPGMVKQLEDRKLDCLISAATVTEAREEQVAFVEYARDPLVFTTRADSIIAGKQDLKGKVVAVQEGTTAQESAERLQRDGAGFRSIITRRSTPEPFSAVREGMADLTLDHQLIARYHSRDGKLKVVGTVGQTLDPEPLGVVLRKNDRALHDALEAAMAALKRSPPGTRAEPEFARLSEKWATHQGAGP